MRKNKRGKIVISLVIFIILFLFISILQTKIIISFNNNLDINSSDDKNSEFNVMPAKKGGVGGGGGKRLSQQQPKKSQEVLLENITLEVKKKQTDEAQVNHVNVSKLKSEVNETAKYDPEILEAFKNQTELPVIVRVIDNSNIAITSTTGTREERRALFKQRDEWFKPVVDEVLASISENDSKWDKLRTGFAGMITKEDFETLINNPKVRSVSWLKRGGQLIQFDSSFLVWLVTLKNLLNDNKISLNLMDYYNDLGINESSLVDFSNVNVNKLYLFNGNPHDVILGFTDQERILNATTSISEGDKEGFSSEGLIDSNHASLTSNKQIKDKIRELIG